MSLDQASESEVAIFARILGNGRGELSHDLARYILELGFGDGDKARMHDLSERNQADTLSAAEREEMFAFAKAGDLLSVLKSKARRTLAMKARPFPRLDVEADLKAALVGLVWRRAMERCEYCQLPQEFSDNPFEIDHVVARKHQGPTVAGNLALSCFRCNSFKGSDLSGLDPRSRELTPLFNPRRHKWDRHFRWDGPLLLGRTPIGRVTVHLLKMDDPIRVELREALIEEGVFPPE